MTENNLFDDLKNLYLFNNLHLINKSNLPFLVKYISNEPLNLGIATQLNKYLFWLDSDILKYALHFGINKNKRYIRYLKIEKKEDEYEWLKSYIQEMYDWSDRELKLNWSIIKILLNNENFKKELKKRFGFGQSECLMLGIDYKQPEFKKGGLGEWL